MTERLLGGKGSGRRRIPTGLAALVGAVVLVLGVPAALGSHGDATLAGSAFEIDDNANLKVDHSSPSIDWVSKSSCPTNAPDCESRRQDTTSGSTDESFGQGAKEDTAEPSVVDGGIPPNKSDLKFFGVYQEGASSAGFLNMFWSRVQDPSGTTNMDFEFNKRQCTRNATPVDPDCSSNGITPLRSVDDILVIYDLAQGGTVPTLSIREWTGSEWGAATELSSSNKAAGSINTSAIPAGESDGLGAHSIRTFGEAQLALSEVFPSGSGCQSFGSAYLKSRSSDSFTAALKDFVPPVAVNITNCGSISIHKQDDAGNALNGVTFTLWNDLAPQGGSPPKGAEDTATSLSCTTTGTGDCTISSVPFGRYWVVEGTPPTGYTAAADQNVTLSGGTATASLTFVNNRNPATVRILKQDDSATPNPLSGVTFTLWSDASPTGPPDGSGGNQDQHGAEDTATSHACTTNASGTCEITGVLTPGKYWIVEGTPPAGHFAAPDQWVDVVLGQTYPSATGRFTFSDPRKFKVIVLVCKKGTSGSTLYAAKVGFDTTTPPASANSLGPNGGGTLTDAQLCALGGATHDDVQKTHDGGANHTAVVKIE